MSWETSGGDAEQYAQSLTPSQRQAFLLGEPLPEPTRAERLEQLRADFAPTPSAAAECGTEPILLGRTPSEWNLYFTERGFPDVRIDERTTEPELSQLLTLVGRLEAGAEGIRIQQEWAQKLEAEWLRNRDR